MSLPKYCVDTHPLVWYFTGEKTLSNKVHKILDGIFTAKAKCFIPTIVILEMFHLSLKFTKFDFPKFLRELRLTNIIFVPLDKVIMEECFHLPKNLEIHDRIIATTAIINGCILLTKDKDLQHLSNLKAVW